LKAAGAEEIARVEGVNAALAERIYATLHGLPDPATSDSAKHDSTKHDSAKHDSQQAE